MSTLKSMGLLNCDSEDFGTLAAAKTKMEYKYLCSSRKCAGEKNEVLKIITSDWLVKCDGCGGLLHSKRYGLKQLK